MNEPETKVCQNCKNSFQIDAEDFDFYKKIDVPPPTFCPTCRMTRRFFWKNERNLYKRKCVAPKHTEEFISMYSPDKNVTLFDKEFWLSDGWNPLDYGTEYDFNRTFFEQFLNLQQKNPSTTVSK